MNIASAVKEPALQVDFFDEKGLLKEYHPKSMYVLSGTSSDKPIMIEFGCGLTPLSFDRKLTLQVDTGADMNAINKETFNEIFPDAELEESTQILQNFDKRLIKPIGSFRCFLRWKGHKYRVKFEVMGIDTPNLLSRETTFLMGIPWNQLLLDYRCTPISSEIPSPAEILFGRKLRSSISILPSQVMNDRISKQRELIAKKEGKFYTNTKDFHDRIKALPFEAGQNVWFKNSDSRKYEEAVIREKCREPNSYMVEIPATGQCFRRNSNFIKPRQTDKNSDSTDPQPTTGLSGIPQESPVLQQPAVPSSPATSTVEAIPTVPPSMQKGNSTPRQPRTSRRSTKGIPSQRLGLQK